MENGTQESLETITKEATDNLNHFQTYYQTHFPEVITFGIKVVVAIIFFLVGRILIHWIRKIVKKSFEYKQVDLGVQQFFDSVLKFGLYFLLIFTIATKFGVDTTSVAALIASAGVALGLALQGSLSNFAGGILILLLKPFQVGDYIIEDNNMKEGTVKEIQIFYTKLTTIDNKTVVIPNGLLTNNSLTNVTAKDERQLDLKVSISYESDLRKAKELLNNLLVEDPSVLKDEDINVFVHELADSGVILGLRGWVRSEDYWTTRWRILENIKIRLDENNITIPYPQIMVHSNKES